MEFIIFSWTAFENMHNSSTLCGYVNKDSTLKMIIVLRCEKNCHLTTPYFGVSVVKCNRFRIKVVAEWGPG
jgi:hypothetical protein